MTSSGKTITRMTITELQAELAEAKNIIEEFIWPSDYSVDDWQRFQKKAAKFAGCTEPSFCSSEGS